MASVACQRNERRENFRSGRYGDMPLERSVGYPKSSSSLSASSARVPHVDRGTHTHTRMCALSHPNGGRRELNRHLPTSFADDADSAGPGSTAPPTRRGSRLIISFQSGVDGGNRYSFRMDPLAAAAGGAEYPRTSRSEPLRILMFLSFNVS